PWPRRPSERWQRASRSTSSASTPTRWPTSVCGGKTSRTASRATTNASPRSGKRARNGVVGLEVLDGRRRAGEEVLGEDATPLARVLGEQHDLAVGRNRVRRLESVP